MVYHQKIAEKINAAQSGNKDSILDLMNMLYKVFRLHNHIEFGRLFAFPLLSLHKCALPS